MNSKYHLSVVCILRIFHHFVKQVWLHWIFFEYRMADNMILHIVNKMAVCIFVETCLWIQMISHFAMDCSVVYATTAFVWNLPSYKSAINKWGDKETTCWPWRNQFGGCRKFWFNRSKLYKWTLSIWIYKYKARNNASSPEGISICPNVWVKPSKLSGNIRIFRIAWWVYVYLLKIRRVWTTYLDGCIS